LKAAVQALRDEMERLETLHEERLEAQQRQHRDEILQLQKTVTALREKWEMHEKKRPST